MTQKQMDMQWLVGEEAWPDDTGDPEVAAEGPELAFFSGEERRLLLWLVQLSALGFVLLFGVAAAPYSHEERIYRQTRAEIAATISLELMALHSDDRRAYHSLIDWTGDPWDRQGRYDLQRIRAADRKGLSLALQDIRLQEDFVVADVLIVPPQSHFIPVPYSETRVYRQRENGWIRVYTPLAFWGTRQTFETEHLRFVFYARDAETVYAAAQEIEDTYLKIYQTLGVPILDEKLTFTLEPRTSFWGSTLGHQISVGSPSLRRIPADATPVEHLISSTTGALTNRAIGDVLAVPEFFYRVGWYNVLLGVHNWLRTDVLAQPPYWQELGGEFLKERGVALFPLRLTDLTERGKIGAGHRLIRYAAAEALVAYVAEKHGQEGVIALLKGMRMRDSWDGLIPMLFDESTDEFTVGWNLHMARRFGYAEDLR